MIIDMRLLVALLLIGTGIGYTGTDHFTSQRLPSSSSWHLKLDIHTKILKQALSFVKPTFCSQLHSFQISPSNPTMPAGWPVSETHLSFLAESLLDPGLRSTS